jgi:uncharacterized protein YjbI with pentapeptide repeats
MGASRSSGSGSERPVWSQRGVGSRPVVLGAAAAVAFLVAIVVVVKLAPVWLGSTDGLTGKDRAEELGRVRTALLAVLAGAIAVLGLYYTGRTFALNRQGHITERFTRAVDQLGHKQVDVRLGGIYALERLARESRDDQGPIVELLTAYVREHAPAPAEHARGKPATLEPPERANHPKASAPSPPDARHPPATDVQAVLTVLARRTTEHDLARPWRLNLRKVDLFRANLPGAPLQAAILIEAHLERADLRTARLESADLAGAHLEGADLADAHLERAVLRGAHLEGVDLADAHLERAVLRGAYLEAADLAGAHLEAADLADAHLQRAVLRGAHLHRAILDHVDLEQAALGEADLRGARLERAGLRDAHLEGADLAGAHLEGADLAGAHLGEADLRGAHLAAATYSRETRWPPGFDPGAAGARLQDHESAGA